MADQIREEIASMVGQSLLLPCHKKIIHFSLQVNNSMYALMADECRDVGGHQQLSIVIRFARDPNDRKVTSSDVVNEYFLGFVALEEFDALSLAEKIIQFLRQLNIPLHSCICLCFGGYGCHILHLVQL